MHIVGDIYDRGPFADRIMDQLMGYHSLDIQWGNHDILWIGAASGSEICMAHTVRNSLKYHNVEMLENGYGISVRNLTLFAEKTYQDQEPMAAALKAITVILFKLEGQVIMRHPEYEMEDRLLLDKINKKKGTVIIEGKEFPMKDKDFPTLDMEHPYRLTEEEDEIVQELQAAFLHSERLQKHISFLCEKGSMYLVFNGNLLYHGCIPLTKLGAFESMTLEGTPYRGKSYLNYADRKVRKVRTEKATQVDRDFVWYLWGGRKSPLCGRNVKTFERSFIEDKSTWKEESNPYYRYHEREDICGMILKEFGLESEHSHIINGHTPIKTLEGEQPVKAGGKLLVIDGGFCRAYHKTTGIAGYTLIYNSHGLRLKSHHPFENINQALEENKDIESESSMIETEARRVMVKDTDIGAGIVEDIKDLKELLEQYRETRG
jgi:fructose-1,6-bisphosphatase-3